LKTCKAQVLTLRGRGADLEDAGAGDEGTEIPQRAPRAEPWLCLGANPPKAEALQKSFL